MLRWGVVRDQGDGILIRVLGYILPNYRKARNPPKEYR